VPGDGGCGCTGWCGGDGDGSCAGDRSCGGDGKGGEKDAVVATIVPSVGSRQDEAARNSDGASNVLSVTAEDEVSGSFLFRAESACDLFFGRWPNDVCC